MATLTHREAILGAEPQFAAAKVELAAGKFLMFADAQVLDIEKFCSMTWPEGWRFDMEVHAVTLRHGQSIEDAIRIYRLDEK